LRKTPFLLLVKPADRPVFQSHLIDVYSTSTKQTCELRLQAEDDLLLYVAPESIAAPEEVEPGIHCRTTMSDITARKQAEDASLKALKAATQQRMETEALLEASPTLLENHSFTITAKSIFDGCKNLIGVTAGYVALLNADGSENEGLFPEAGGLPCSVDPNLPVPIRGLWQEAYQLGTAVYENDFPHSAWQKFMPQGKVVLQNVLFAPPKLEETAVGLLGLANKPGGFTENDARLATAFGDLAAIALHNSRTMDSLRQSEALFRVIFEQAAVGVAQIETGTGRFFMVNQKYCDIIGLTPEEMMASSFMDITHPDDLQADLDNMERRKGGLIRSFSREKRYVRRDGAIVWVNLTVSPMWAAGEPPNYHIALVEDITERKRIELELITTKTWMAKAFPVRGI
jgi:PAS domain S-box-containing protein